MTIKVDTITLPAYWASALVNGDYSGMDPGDVARCKKREADLAADGWRVVDVCRDDAGEAWESRFTDRYDLYDPGSGYELGEVLDYLMHSRALVEVS